MIDAQISQATNASPQASHARAGMAPAKGPAGWRPWDPGRAVARRFERDCRRRAAGWRLRVETIAGDAGVELKVAADGDPSRSLSVSGLDVASWRDPAGVKALARVVDVLLEPPAAMPPVPSAPSQWAATRRRPAHQNTPITQTSSR